MSPPENVKYDMMGVVPIHLVRKMTHLDSTQIHRASSTCVFKLLLGNVTKGFWKVTVNVQMDGSQHTQSVSPDEELWLTREADFPYYDAFAHP